MTIANKWKVFALNQILSDYKGEGAEVFDRLVDSDENTVADVFEEFAVVQWHPFESTDAYTITDIILQMATSAQHTENDTQ